MSVKKVLYSDRKTVCRQINDVPIEKCNYVKQLKAASATKDERIAKLEEAMRKIMTHTRYGVGSVSKIRKIIGKELAALPVGECKKCGGSGIKPRGDCTKCIPQTRLPSDFSMAFCASECPCPDCSKEVTG